MFFARCANFFLPNFMRILNFGFVVVVNHTNTKREKPFIKFLNLLYNFHMNWFTKKVILVGYSNKIFIQSCHIYSVTIKKNILKKLSLCYFMGLSCYKVPITNLEKGHRDKSRERKRYWELPLYIHNTNTISRLELKLFFIEIKC